MPVEFKSIQEKEAEIITDVETSTGQTVPIEEIAFDRINARSIAGMSKLSDMGITTALRDTLLSKTQDLSILAEFTGYTDVERSPGTQAQLAVTGTGTPNETIQGGAGGVQYISDDGQKFYFDYNPVVNPDGSVDELLTAFLPGPQANLSSGQLSITAQNEHISDKLDIDFVYVAGTDEETIEQWRTEMMRVMKKPVIADNGSYYFRTARERPNIVAGYAYANDPGSMDVYIESDASDGVPTSSQLFDMEQYFRGNIDGVVRLRPRLEMNMPDGFTPRFVIHASQRNNHIVTIKGFTPATAENVSAVTQAIRDWYETRKPYIKGVSIDNTGTITTNSIGAVVQSVIDSVGADSYESVTLEVGGTEYTEYPLGRGERAYGIVAWES